MNACVLSEPKKRLRCGVASKTWSKATEVSVGLFCSHGRPCCMWYSGLACSQNALAAARFCVQSPRTRALPLLGFCAIVPEAPRVDWPVGLGAGGADEARRPTLWRVSGCALDRFHRASRVAFIVAGTRGPGRPQSRLLFGRRHKMAAPRAGLKRALGESGG